MHYTVESGKEQFINDSMRASDITLLLVARFTLLPIRKLLYFRIGINRFVIGMLVFTDQTIVSSNSCMI